MKFIYILVISSFSSSTFSQAFEKDTLLDNYYGREVEFGDFDKDGDLDLLMFYTYAYFDGEPFTSIFENTESGFKLLDYSLPIVEEFGNMNGAATWGDVNNDGFLDVLLIISTWIGFEAKVLINNGDKTFSEMSILISDLSTGTCSPSWADFDNDGDIDLTIFRRAGSSHFTIKVYENDLNNQEFTPIDFDFGNCILKSRTPWGDFNNDGYLDLLVNEPNDDYGSNIAIFKNNGDKTFSKIIFPNLIGLSQDVSNQSGEMKWGDYDNDGDLDIIINGQHTDSNGSGISKLFQNSGNENFVEIQLEGLIPSYSDVHIEWGDFDNDGNLDLFKYGRSGSQNKTSLYTNINDNFEDTEIEFLDSRQGGMATCGDFNGDNNLDLIVFGSRQFGVGDHLMVLYKNNFPILNSRPLPPDSLYGEVVDSELILYWNEGSDTETPNEALSYNIYLIYEGDTIVQPNSTLEGRRTLVGIGNAQKNKFYKINISKNGKYEWGVQSIDNSYIGSTFSDKSIIEVGELSSTEDLNDLIQSEVLIYPNPFVDRITISSKREYENLNISLFDVNGCEIFDFNNIILPYSIETTHISNGVYLLSVHSKSSIINRKIIKM